MQSTAAGRESSRPPAAPESQPRNGFSLVDFDRAAGRPDQLDEATVLARTSLDDATRQLEYGFAFRGFEPNATSWDAFVSAVRRLERLRAEHDMRVRIRARLEAIHRE